MKTMRKVFFRWEWLVVGLTVLTYFLFQFRLGGSYTVMKLVDQTRVYVVDIGFMAIGTMMVLILGDIDISVGSTAALSVTVMGVAYNGGRRPSLLGLGGAGAINRRAVRDDQRPARGEV